MERGEGEAGGGGALHEDTQGHPGGTGLLGEVVGAGGLGVVTHHFDVMPSAFVVAHLEAVVDGAGVVAGEGEVQAVDDLAADVLAALLGEGGAKVGGGIGGIRLPQLVAQGVAEANVEA